MTVPFTHIDRLYIDGAWVAPAAGSETVINPATGAPIGEAPQASLAQVDAAIAACQRLAIPDAQIYREEFVASGS